ncbi:hypothetical protein [Nonomuraea zeae]|uniref:hypothetical protein n=1 Tax=Nonomuraea zeae TaxID=1642303 RepID=UPI001478342A|nr:hypothetical protein [Nonomuraea zeae]
MAHLTKRAGKGDVVDNLVDAIETLSAGNLLALTGLAMAGPSIITHLGKAHADGTLELYASERAFTAYLRAEQEHGRIRADDDVESIALAHPGLARRRPARPHAQDSIDLDRSLDSAGVTALGFTLSTTSPAVMTAPWGSWWPSSGGGRRTATAGRPDVTPSPPLYTYGVL